MSKDQKAPLIFIGLGDHGLKGLSLEALGYIKDADRLIGGARHLAMLTDAKGKQVAWPSPWATLAEHVPGWLAAGEKLVVLTSGDPFWFGPAKSLLDQLDTTDWQSMPHASAFQLAANRLAWSLDTCHCLSLHGRSIETVLPYLSRGGRLLLLAESRTASQLTNLLQAKGFKQVQIQVLEHVQGQAEQVYTYPDRPDEALGPLDQKGLAFAAENPDAVMTASLSTLAVDLGSSRVKGALSGLPDEAFEHDGQLTKQEVRAVTLAKLAPKPDEILWDLGAGCGSVAIEWCRLCPEAKALAFERVAERIAMIKRNALKLGAFALQTHACDLKQLLLSDEGRASPSSLSENSPFEQPNAIFIGGGLSRVLLENMWDRLPEGGRLVANAVTLESEQLLIAFPQELGLEPSAHLTRVAVERPIAVGPKYGWKPFMTLTQLALIK